MDYVEVEPGGSIGRHLHGPDEEEFYLVLDGHGWMYLDGIETAVRAGDLVRNRPGGEHGLTNVGDDTLRLFVFEVEVEVTDREAEPR
ncbi:cupin domain-containing protein [Streptomyces sp. 7N604]|uniref:cupin domain-containing protein n=1 Tax=Streptomyces sp. 7N604 TaxID=3457415 RepID=UPI003FCFB78D